MASGIGSHQSARAGKTEWLTPPDLLAQLGPFDLDPCAPVIRPWPMAAEHYTIESNGLLKRWPRGARAFVNPPYSEPELSAFMGRLAEHGRGTALVFARTETEWFFRYGWRAATAMLFIEGRLHFHHVDGRRADHNAGAPSVLMAYGEDDARHLSELDQLGQFQPLLLPRSVAVLAVPETWRDLVSQIMQQRGPMRLDDLYRAIERHAKAAGRKHWREQVRKVLQCGPFERVAPATWSLVL
jgi:hypothetical protein